MLVAERDGEVVAWAKASPYGDPHDYEGVREATLYAEQGARRSGSGTELLEALCDAPREVGHHKLIGKIFASNEASGERSGGGGLCRRCGGRIGRRLRGECEGPAIAEAAGEGC